MRLWHRSAIGMACAMLCVLATAQPVVETDADTATVPVSINDQPSGQVDVSLNEQGQPEVRTKQLKALVPGAKLGETEWTGLTGLEGLDDFKFDNNELTLSLHVKPELLPAHAYKQEASAITPLEPAQGSTLLNYSLQTQTDGQSNGYLETSTALWDNNLTSTSSYASGSGAKLHTMTLSHYFDTGNKLLQVGSAHWQGLGDSATDFNGIHFLSDYTADPEQRPRPRQGVSGYASTASTVDVYLNGALVAREYTPAGPFSFNDITSVNGSNNLVAVVKDSSGHETRFGTTGVFGLRSLAAGSMEYDTALGQLPGRTAPAALGVIRYGITPSATLGAEAVYSNELSNVGLSSAVYGTIGSFELTAIGSQTPKQHGASFSATYEGSWKSGYFNANHQTNSEGYQDTSTLGSLLPPSRSTDLLNAGWNVTGNFSSNLRYEHHTYAAADPSVVWDGQATWRLGRNTSLTFEYRDQVKPTHDPSIFAILSLSLGNGRQVDTTATHSARSTQYSADYSIMRNGDIGWSGRGRAGRDSNGSSGDLELDGLFSYGQVGLKSHLGQNSVTQASLQGAVAITPNALTLGPPGSGSFLVVDTHGLANTPVRVNGRLAGKTDDHGYVTLTGLNPYSPVKVAVDPDKIPQNYSIATSELSLRVPGFGGANVSFPVKPRHAAEGRLVNAKGAPLSYGSFKMGGTLYALGEDGEFFLDDAADMVAPLQARIGTQLCSVSELPAPVEAEGVTDFGNLVCVPTGKAATPLVLPAVPKHKPLVPRHRPPLPDLPVIAVPVQPVQWGTHLPMSRIESASMDDDTVIAHAAAEQSRRAAAERTAELNAKKHGKHAKVAKPAHKHHKQSPDAHLVRP